MGAIGKHCGNSDNVISGKFSFVASSYSILNHFFSLMSLSIRFLPLAPSQWRNWFFNGTKRVEITQVCVQYADSTNRVMSTNNLYTSTCLCSWEHRQHPGFFRWRFVPLVSPPYWNFFLAVALNGTVSVPVAGFWQPADRLRVRFGSFRHFWLQESKKRVAATDPVLRMESTISYWPAIWTFRWVPFPSACQCIFTVEARKQSVSGLIWIFST